MASPNTFNMVDEALHLAGQGFRVFPVSRSKVPFKGSHGYLDATTDPATIEAMWRRRPHADIAIATGEGLVVLDIDGPRGRETLAGLIEQHGALPATLRVRSGRLEGGQHAYFAVDRQVGNSAGGGLEIRGDGGYVVAPPSLHKSGRRYEWLNQLPIADAPAWLYELSGRGQEQIANPKDDRLNTLPVWLRSNPLPPLTPEVIDLPEIDDLAACVALIPNKNREWEDWNRIGMAIFAASGGAEYGRKAWLAFSRLSDKFDEERTLERWRHYAKSPPTSIGFGSLVFEAREVQPDFELPSREPKLAQPQELAEEVKEEPQDDPFFEQNQEKLNGHASLQQLFSEIDLDKPGNPLIKLNEKYAVIGDLGGKCLVMAWVDSKVERSVKVPSFQSFKSFTERYAHKYVTLTSLDDHGEKVEEVKALGAYWLKWGRRRTFEGIDLVPNGEGELPGKVLNLWQGFAVEPVPGAWPLLKRHILDVLASGDLACAAYILRWAAWAVQHPGERAEAALVLKGGKGSGKGTFADAIRQIFGQHGLHIFNSKHLVGAFNGHLRNCLFLFADEAFWAGDKQGESVLKGMLTEPVLMIEQKGIDATAWKNRLHVIMAANADWVVPASHDERRYAVFEVSGERIGDESYFRELHAEMKNGGLAAMLHDLLALDLKDWHPRKIVRTAALVEQKARSLDPLHEWWESVLQSGVLPGVPDVTGSVPALVVFEYARREVPRLKDASDTRLGRFLRVMGCEGIHRKTGSFWRFPHVIDARKMWEDKFGQWHWRDKLADWQV